MAAWLPTAKMTDVTFEDLWLAMKVDPKRAGADSLREAIALGKSGKRALAFKALAAYHRDALQEEWQHISSEVNQQPEPRQSAIDNLLAFRINTWHHQVIDFNGKIDWFHPEAVATGVVGGFHYWGWVTPALNAYIRSGDDKLGRFIADVIAQYANVSKHPDWSEEAGEGRANKVIVYNTLAIGAKVDRWIPAYLALIHYGHLTTAAAETVMTQFLGYGRAIEPQNKEFHAHNIQTHGCRALLQLCRLFPEFREAKAWDKFACKRLVEQVTKGYFPDGCHDERVWGYSAATLRSLSTAYDLAKRVGGLGEHDKPYLRGLRKAYRFFAETVGPKPEMFNPTYGDAGVGNTAHDTLKHGRRFFPKGTNEDLGADRTKSYCYPKSGFAIMRNGDDKDSTYINLSFGPFTGWHNHYDLLSMNVWSKGERWLEECCRFGPYSVPLDHSFRAPEAHNLVTIDGMIYDSRNKVGEDVVWHSTDVADYFSASHWAYHYFVFGRDSGPVSPNMEAKVRRSVLFVKDPGYVVVLDAVSDRVRPSKFNRAITQIWHSPYEIRKTDKTAAAIKNKKAGVAMAWARSEGLARLDTGSDFLKSEGDQWGAAYDRYRLDAKRWMGLDHQGIVGFATLIYPHRGAKPDVSIRALHQDERKMWRDESFEITTPAGKDTVTICPEPVDASGRPNPKAKPHVQVKLGNRRGAFECK